MKIPKKDALKIKFEKHILYNKLQKIIFKSRIDPCRRYQCQLSSFDDKLINYKQSPKYYQTEITKSSFFNPHSIRTSYNTKQSLFQQYVQTRDDRIASNNKLNEVDCSIERDYIIEQILKELTLSEIEIIFNNLEFFIKEKYVRDMLGLIDEKDNKLYQTLDKEENENRLLSKKERIKENLINKKNEIIKLRNLKNRSKILTDDGYIYENNEIENYYSLQNSEKILKNKISENKKMNYYIKQKALNIHSSINKMITDSQKNVVYLNRNIKDNKLTLRNNQKNFLKRHSGSLFCVDKKNSFIKVTNHDTINSICTTKPNETFNESNVINNNNSIIISSNNISKMSNYRKNNESSILRFRSFDSSKINNGKNEGRRRNYYNDLSNKQLKEANINFIISKHTKEIKDILKNKNELNNK